MKIIDYYTFNNLFLPLRTRNTNFVINVENNPNSENIYFICKNGEIVSPSRYPIYLFITVAAVSNVISCYYNLFLLANGDLYVKKNEHEMILLSSSINFIHEYLCVDSQGRLHRYDSPYKLKLIETPPSFNIIDTVKISNSKILLLGADNKLGLIINLRDNPKFIDIDLSDKLHSNQKKSARK